MGIEITTLTDEDEWNQLVDRTAQATPFHRYEALEVIAEHSGATLHPYAGFKGQEPVGIFPVFEISKGPVSAAFSPPPDLKISYLGPALIHNGNLKRRRLERTNKRFVNGCLDEVQSTIDPKFSLIRTAIGYTDPRPFMWREYDSTARYTYVVDLTPSTDDILMEFSSDARKNVTNTDPASYEIFAGDRSDAIESIERTKQRHDEQDVSFNVTPSFVGDLYDHLPDDVFRVYVCEVDGEFCGGHITLEHGDTIYGWQSWGSMDASVPVNDLLEWTIMQDAKERGLTQYDLVGANHERISQYKSKFGQHLVPFVRVQDGSRSMNIVSNIYKKIR